MGEERCVIVRIRSEKAFISILLKCGMVLYVFFMGCKDKPLDSYDRKVAPPIKDEQNLTVSNETVAIEEAPESAETCISRAVLYYSKGKYDQAISDYTKAIEIKPGDAKTFYNRGNAYNAKGQFDEAISDYIKAIEDHKISLAEYDMIIHQATEDGNIDHQEKVVKTMEEGRGQ